MLARDFARYFAAGLLQLAFDFAIFTTLLFYYQDARVANFVSRLVCAIAGFWLQRAVFQAGNGIKREQALRFILLWCISTAIGALCLQWILLNYGTRESVIAKLFLEAVLAISNFFAMRHWVFRGNDQTGSTK